MRSVHISELEFEFVGRRLKRSQVIVKQGALGCCELVGLTFFLQVRRRFQLVRELGVDWSDQRERVTARLGSLHGWQDQWIQESGTLVGSEAPANHDSIFKRPAAFL